MKPRVIKYSDWTPEKGMDSLETVEYYDHLFSKFKFFYRRIAKKALELKPDANDIADIGTGPGFLAIELAKLTGKKVKAVDLSLNMLKKASSNAHKAGVQIEPVRANAQDLPFDDESLDLVTASYLIHFLEDDVMFFSELKRVIRPGGKALLGGFHRDISAFILSTLDTGSKIFLRNKPLHGVKPVINASFTKKEIEADLKKAGLQSFSVTTGIIGMQIIIDF